MDGDLERKLRDLIDRQEIWSVMVRYSRGIDRLDREIVRSAYHDDATDDHQMFVGAADAFIDWAFDLHGGAQVNTHHILTNHSCEIVGDDAYAETYYTYLGQNKEPPHLMSMGRYIDHLQRRDGVWRIFRRVCVIESGFDLTETNMQNIQEASLSRTDPLPPATRDRGDVSYLRPPVSPWTGTAAKP